MLCWLGWFVTICISPLSSCTKGYCVKEEKRKQKQSTESKDNRIRITESDMHIWYTCIYGSTCLYSIVCAYMVAHVCTSIVCAYMVAHVCTSIVCLLVWSNNGSTCLYLNSECSKRVTDRHAQMSGVHIW